MTNTPPATEYDAYIGHRKSLIDAELEQSRLFDRAILTLASGALGLSITFIHDIAPHPVAGSPCWLIAGWTAFALSMLITLISFLTSQWACRTAWKKLDDAQRTGRVEAGTNLLGTITGGLNIASALAFISGVFLLIRFVALNLNTSGG